MDSAVLAHVNGSLGSYGAGSAAVTSNGNLLLARADDEGFVMDLTTGEQRATFPAHSSLDPTPAADDTAFATYDGEAVEIRDLPDGDLVAAFPLDVTVHTPTGRDLLAPGGDHVYLNAFPRVEWARYDTATGGVEHTYPAVEDDEAVGCFALSVDGTRAAVAGIKSPVNAGFVAIYAAASGELVTHQELAYDADRVALSPDGSGAVLTDGIGGLVAGGWRSDETDGVVTDAQFVRDGTCVVSVTQSGTLDLWDAATGARVATHATGTPASTISADADGDLVAVSGRETRLTVPEWTD